MILWCLLGHKGSAHFKSATPLSSDMGGNCCLVCVRQQFPPKIPTVIPYLISAYWVLGNVQDTSTVPATHARAKARWQLALRCASRTAVDGILLKQSVSTAIQLQSSSKKAVKETECILFA